MSKERDFENTWNDLSEDAVLVSFAFLPSLGRSVTMKVLSTMAGNDVLLNEGLQELDDISVLVVDNSSEETLYALEVDFYHFVLNKYEREL